MSKEIDEYIHNQKQRGMWFEAPKFAIQAAKMVEHQNHIANILFKEHQAEVLNNHREN